MFKDAGFSGVAITHRFDCFDGTTKVRTARKYRIEGVNLFAIWPGV